MTDAMHLMQNASFARLVFCALIVSVSTDFVLRKRTIDFRFFGSVWKQKGDQFGDHKIWSRQRNEKDT